MDKIKSVAICGMGAVGAVVAQQLSTVSDLKLYCVMNQHRVEYYSKEGIFINSIKQNFNYVTPEELPQVDLVIIATKNLQLQEALKEIQNGIGNQTAILSLLNGIQSEREISAIFGTQRTLYGFIIDLNSINIKGKIQCDKYGTIVFGEKNNQLTERILAIQELFTEAKVDFRTPQSIELEMWKKFLINTVFNSLGAITYSPYGGFNFEVMQDLARKIGYEVVEVANKYGISLTKEMVEEDIAKTCSYIPTGKCSMVQDSEAHRKTENAFFCGTISKLGKEFGIPTPYNEFLYKLIEGRELVYDKFGSN